MCPSGPPSTNSNPTTNMETALPLQTGPPPAKAVKRRRLNAVLEKLAAGSLASAVELRPAMGPATVMELQLSVAEERSPGSEESEEERPASSSSQEDDRPLSSSSAAASPRTELEDSGSPSSAVLPGPALPASPSALPASPTSHPFFGPLPPGATGPPGLDYLKSQLLSKMYLQQYVSNNISNMGGGLVGPPGGRRERAAREARGGRRPAGREDCNAPLDLSRPAAPAQESHGGGQLHLQFPFPSFPGLQLPPGSPPARDEGVSPPPSSPGLLSSKGVVEATASPPTSTHGCPVCGQQFSIHDRLAKHMASRHKAHRPDPQSKAYFCEVCRRSFARSDMLTRHVRLHTGLKPYTCRVCSQVFSRSDHLSTHQRTHTGEKPYKCPSCPYSACRRDMITRHMRTHSRFSMGDSAALVEAAQREAALKLAEVQ